MAQARKRVLEMTQQSSKTMSTGDQLLAAQRNAEKILAQAAQLGIVAEATIQPGNHTRFLYMSKAQQAQLLEGDAASVEAYRAALEYASDEPVSELTISRIERALNASRTQKLVNGRPELIDTQEARAEAVRSFGINI